MIKWPKFYYRYQELSCRHFYLPRLCVAASCYIFFLVCDISFLHLHLTLVHRLVPLEKFLIAWVVVNTLKLTWTIHPCTWHLHKINTFQIIFGPFKHVLLFYNISILICFVTCKNKKKIMQSTVSITFLYKYLSSIWKMWRYTVRTSYILSNPYFSMT